MEEMIFESIIPIEIPVRIAGVQYVLVEAKGKAAVQWRNMIGKGVRISTDASGDNPIAVNEGHATADAYLVSLTLFALISPRPDSPQGTPSTRQLVPMDVILEWPSHIYRSLAQKVKDISRLEERDDADILKKRIARDQKRLTILTKNGQEGEADPTKLLQETSK